MFAKASSALAGTFLLSLAASVSAQGNTSSCSVCEDTKIFLARGNNEPYPGRQAFLVEAICDGLASCGYEDLIYSALYTDLYCQSAYDGAIAGIVQMTEYAERCPNSKIILGGYSQGGQIASDILGGGGGVEFNGCIQPDTPALSRDTSPGNKIAAVIIFGDTRHTANQPYNYGNGSAINGWFPRPESQLQALDAYSSIMRNWCVSTDPICAANQTFWTEAAHLGYYDRDSQAAASWVKSVASLTQTSAFTTTIPTSISGTVQDYATVPTGTPSGSVHLDTTWSNIPSYTACTLSSYSGVADTTVMPSTTSATIPINTSGAGSVNATKASVFPLTASTSGVAQVSTTASASSSVAASNDAISFLAVPIMQAAFVACLLMTVVFVI